MIFTHTANSQPLSVKLRQKPVRWASNLRLPPVFLFAASFHLLIGSTEESRQLLNFRIWHLVCVAGQSALKARDENESSY